MARIARVVVPGIPYHVTHRGNRRAAVFYRDDDRETYMAFLKRHAQKPGLAISSLDDEEISKLRINTLSGRPCGSEDFVKDIENRLGRILRTPRPGRPPNHQRIVDSTGGSFHLNKFWLSLIISGTRRPPSP